MFYTGKLRQNDKILQAESEVSVFHKEREFSLLRSIIHLSITSDQRQSAISCGRNHKGIFWLITTRLACFTVIASSNATLTTEESEVEITTLPRLVKIDLFVSLRLLDLHGGLFT